MPARVIWFGKNGALAVRLEFPAGVNCKRHVMSLGSIRRSDLVGGSEKWMDLVRVIDPSHLREPASRVMLRADAPRQHVQCYFESA